MQISRPRPLLYSCHVITHKSIKVLIFTFYLFAHFGKKDCVSNSQCNPEIQVAEVGKDTEKSNCDLLVDEGHKKDSFSPLPDTILPGFAWSTIYSFLPTVGHGELSRKPVEKVESLKSISKQDSDCCFVAYESKRKKCAKSIHELKWKRFWLGLKNFINTKLYLLCCKMNCCTRVSWPVFLLVSSWCLNFGPIFCIHQTFRSCDGHFFRLLPIFSELCICCFCKIEKPWFMYGIFWINWTLQSRRDAFNGALVAMLWDMQYTLGRWFA